jgi:predicted Zn-dependent protease
MALQTPLKEWLPKLQTSEITWLGLREVRETNTMHTARDLKPEENSNHTTHGVMLEVLVDGQFGYASTPRLTLASLERARDLAVAQARKAAQFAVHTFTVAQRPPITRDYSSSVQKALNSLPPKELNSLLIQITEKLKLSSKIARTVAIAHLAETEIHFVSSNGSDARQYFSFITTDFQATAQEGSLVQRRTDGGMRGRCLQGGWEKFYGADLWDRVRTVAEQSVELLAAPQCPTETTSLVLAPDQMMLQIHESIGHPLELDRILGDERNYAGWSFVKLEDFGRLQYGSKLMNVTFDPTVSDEFASYAWDDIGAEAKREFLIQDGILKRGLGSLESQLRAKVPGVSNQRACSWNRAPIDRMANINLEPGTSSWDEIIGSIESGVYMESNRAWSIDDFRNKFQFGCEYARKIENGKLGSVLRNPNYRGITNPFWRSLAKVGSRETMRTYGTPNCGKGEPNQQIRVGHASPVCLFENVEVFGGA